MKYWFRIIELFLLTVIAATLIIGQLAQENGDELDTPDGIINLIQWPVSTGGNGHWYGVLDQELFWEEAVVKAGQAEFKSQRGYLATITSNDENRFISNQVIQQTHQPSVQDAFWLGGFLTSTGWEWTTKEPFEFENWSLYEPNNIEDEIALSLWGPNNWGDRTRPGQWNNLLPNGSINRLHRNWSVVEWGDFDIGAEAITYDSLIRLIKWPVRDGGNDHWYGIIAIDTYHDEAVKLARSFEREGATGHLATITSKAENEFIVKQVVGDFRQTCQIDEYWLGGVWSDGEWTWLDESDWQFDIWSPGEPNNLGRETSLCMWGPTASGKRRTPGTWNNCLPRAQEGNDLAHFYSIIEFDTAK